MRASFFQIPFFHEQKGGSGGQYSTVLVSEKSDAVQIDSKGGP